MLQITETLKCKDDVAVLGTESLEQHHDGISQLSQTMTTYSLHLLYHYTASLLDSTCTRQLSILV